MTIGILALQGAVQDHEKVFHRLEIETRQIRTIPDLDGIGGLVLPGGESTVMAMYLREYGLDAEIEQRAAEGLPVFGFCAGAILLCSEVLRFPGDSPQKGALGLIEARATRNAYGRQLASFEEELDTELGPFPGIFIRAPRLTPLGSTSVIGSRKPQHGSEPVILRQGTVLAAAFHPELSGDDRIHRYFVDLCSTRSSS